MSLYWAYGSNLDPAQMRRRAPRAKRVGPLQLNDGALIFRGVADVVSRQNSQIAGGVWRLTKECERELDRVEGIANGFYRKRYIKLKVKGVSEDCLYYQMNTKDKARRGIMPPSIAYIDTIIKGYEYFGLDLTLLNAALEEAWGDKQVTPHLRERHIRRGRPLLAQPGHILCA
jgi:gamma-glutamylcyclotransferase (GGCT)/AIG2-like uncharacterized protein YtfP